MLKLEKRIAKEDEDKDDREDYVQDEKKDTPEIKEQFVKLNNA